MAVMKHSEWILEMVHNYCGKLYFLEVEADYRVQIKAHINRDLIWTMNEKINRRLKNTPNFLEWREL